MAEQKTGIRGAWEINSTGKVLLAAWVEGDGEWERCMKEACLMVEDISLSVLCSEFNEMTIRALDKHKHTVGHAVN